MSDEIKKAKELHPRKLMPPPEVAKRIVDRAKAKMPRNPILKFFVIFCGEGF